jgi:hypothetical protein
MKKLLPILAFAGIGLLAACHSQTKMAAAVATKQAETPAVVANSEASGNATSAQPQVLPAATGAAPASDVVAFLKANNLAPLWQADFGRQGNSSARPTILDGFYGDEYRHIAFIFERVVRDATQPYVFRVQGKTRYKKDITAFDGTITVDGIKPLTVFLDLDSATQASARSYTATARFELREDPTATGAGTYRGTALMDFYRLDFGKLDLAETLPDNELPTGGGGLLFRGQWHSNHTKRQQAVAFATYTQAVLPDTMTDFYLGDRGESINPKYARLDWSEAWENEEWWAKSPKPTLSL